MTIHVPTIRLERDRDPRFQPHVLVVAEIGGGDKDYEIEHPRFCPRKCWWSPDAAKILEEERARAAEGGIAAAGPDEYDCYVAWTVVNDGIDGLYGELDGEPIEGFGDGWKKLPAGRYVFEGWYSSGGWAGAEPVDPDGGLTLLGREGEV